MDSPTSTHVEVRRRDGVPTRAIVPVGRLPITRGGGGGSGGASTSRSTGVASTGRPAAARSTSARISAALWYRFARFFASALSTTASTSGGTSRLESLGGRGSSRTCWYATETGLSPTNGGCPVSSS